MKMSSQTTQILLIISNSDLRQLYHEILITEHWEIISVDHPANGLLQLVANSDFKLIVLDLLFPYNEIKNFLQISTHKSKWNQIPILFLDYQEAQFSIKKITKNIKTCSHIDTHHISPNQLIKIAKNLMS